MVHDKVQLQNLMSCVINIEVRRVEAVSWPDEKTVSFSRTTLHGDISLSSKELNVFLMCKQINICTICTLQLLQPDQGTAGGGRDTLLHLCLE
jgi:hypothetical protein